MSTSKVLGKSIKILGIKVFWYFLEATHYTWNFSALPNRPSWEQTQCLFQVLAGAVTHNVYTVIVLLLSTPFLLILVRIPSLAALSVAPFPPFPVLCSDSSTCFACLTNGFSFHQIWVIRLVIRFNWSSYLRHIRVILHRLRAILNVCTANATFTKTITTLQNNACYCCCCCKIRRITMINSSKLRGRTCWVVVRGW